MAGTSDPGDTVDGWQTEQAEACIQTVWLQAAAPWCRAVRDGRIRSRVAVTNAAILNAIAARPGGRLLDLGCGEGWLLRALSGNPVWRERIGVDASPELVALAQSAGGGRFLCGSYGRLTTANLGRFDLIVANFSLLGETSSQAALCDASALLGPGGELLIQTLPPANRQGWQPGSWQGCGEGFGPAAPWFARTLDGWRSDLQSAGLRLHRAQIHLDPASGQALSLLLTATPTDD